MLRSFLYYGPLCFIVQSIISVDTKPEHGHHILSLSQGLAQGRPTHVKGVHRFSLPYAQPPTGPLRYRDPRPALKWRGVYRATDMPSPCPQGEPDVPPGESTFYQYFDNDDCLYITTYIPDRLVGQPKGAPVFVWLHGGSLLQGSASGYGLDGSSLATKSGMIVILAQYRLGLNGFLRTAASASQEADRFTGNYAIKDIVMALDYIRQNAASLGGDGNRITLAGQSSGASLIKTLLTVKAADNLFQRAILHSAPLANGDFSVLTSERLGTAAYSSRNISVKQLRTWNHSAVLDLQSELKDLAPMYIPGIPRSEPFKPVVDHSLVGFDLIRTLTHPESRIIGNNREIIFTTVKHEAAPTISSVVGQRSPASMFEALLRSSTPREIADPIMASKIYSSELKDRVSKNNPEASRDTLTEYGTDWTWRCPTQQVAVNLTLNTNKLRERGKVWLAEFEAGIPYNSTLGIDYCHSKVCHEDDILTVFGLPADRKLDQTSERLIEEVQSRWAAFAAHGNPNTGRHTRWDPVQGSNQLNLLKIGSKASVSVQQQRPVVCQQLWGVKVPYDAQIDWDQRPYKPIDWCSVSHGCS